MKKTLRNLILLVGAFVALNAHAQVNDTVIALANPVTSDAIIYAKIKLNDIDGLGTYNAGITLSQDTIIAWGDYSSFIRFNNVSNTVNTNSNVIDLRDGAAFATVTEILNFEVGKTYQIWFEVSFAAETYNMYVQPEGASSFTKIYEAAAFRKTTPTALNYLSSLRNAAESANTISVIEQNQVANVGDATAVTSAASIADHSAVTLFPNPAYDKVNILNASLVKKVDIFDMSGKLVVSSSEKSLNVSSLSKGIYVVKFDAKGENLHPQLLIKK